MPLIGRRRVSLSLEHMSQMPTTVCAHYLYPLHAERPVCMPCDRAWDGVEESRPAASGLELLVCAVEGCAASGAGVCTLAWVVLVVGAREGSLGALLADDAELF